MDTNAKLAAARDLLAATKHNLQVVDAQLAMLRNGRVPLALANDVASEHRAAWLGAVDDNPSNHASQEYENVGVWFPVDDAASFGLANPRTATIRNQEDAAFVCTDILVASAEVDADDNLFFSESPDLVAAPGSLGFFTFYNPYLRLTDGSSGRNLITGMTVGPLDKDRGAVPFTYFTGARPGIGPHVNSRLFSEFTIPRAGTVKVEIFNLSPKPGATTGGGVRFYVTLLGYKVYGA